MPSKFQPKPGDVVAVKAPSRGEVAQLPYGSLSDEEIDDIELFSDAMTTGPRRPLATIRQRTQCRASSRSWVRIMTFLETQ
jgi:hypothetical protein